VLLVLWRKIDADEKGKASGSFLGARVAIDINKPLRRGLFLRDETRKTNVWFEAQYEKLPIFFFSCGLMGHSEIDCPNPALRGSDGKLPYDVRLRAPFEKSTTGITRDEQHSNGSHSKGKESAGNVSIPSNLAL
jgi:hypothetical protein